MAFLSESSIWIYLFIFFGKILEVTVSTIRIVLINRGERVRGSILAFFEILIWLFVTGTVLSGFQSDFLRVFVFALAFAIGNFLGSWMEDKLAFGLCSIQVIIPESTVCDGLAAQLRGEGFAVTTTTGMGKDGEREIMFLHIKRKKIRQAVKIITSCAPKAVVVVNDSKVLHGGFIKK